MENETKNYGFIPSVIDENIHWMLGDGSLNPTPLMPDGHGWAAFLPQDDLQNKNGLETFNCTSYGTFHALATLGKQKFGIKFQQNLSERFIGRIAGTTKFGNDPHRVAETIRAVGVIPEVYLPFDDFIKTWEQYYPKIIAYWLWATGQHWLKTYSFSHDWVFSVNDTLAQKQKKMMEALKYSPLGASGYAWSQHSDGLFYSDQTYKNHWYTVYEFEFGKNWSAFDSYDLTHKKLDWNYDFGQSKRYSIEKNISGENININSLGYIPFYLSSLFS